MTSMGRTIAIAGLVCGTLAAWLTSAWAPLLHDWLVQFFTYPTNPLVAVRRESQIPLLLWHGRLALSATTLLVAFWKPAGAYRWLLAALVLGYGVRAGIWIVGGNLLMVQADSAHHWCLGDNIAKGQGPTLDYVASFFRVYPRFGMVDDWSMPLYGYYLAGAFLLLGNSLTVAKGATFLINWASILALYCYARRIYDHRSGVACALAIAVFPPHAICASYLLKESLYVFVSIVAVAVCLHASDAGRKAPFFWAIAAGVLTGLTILSRRTGLAVAAAVFLFTLTCKGTAKTRLLLFWGIAVAATVAPWAWATYIDYGSPLYSYTNNFKYMPSWPDHWIYRGEPTRADYLKQPIGNIAKTKLAMVWILANHYWFILTPIVVVSLLSQPRRLWTESAARLTVLITLGFVGGTLANIASLDQVRDFGRYFLPVLVLTLPIACQRLLKWLDVVEVPASRSMVHAVAAVVTASCFWSAYPWTHSYDLLGDRWHLQLVRYQLIGAQIRETLPQDAIVMTYHPWEVHMYGDRRTVLLPRNFDPRRAREEVETYRVTHVVLDRSMGPALQGLAAEFQLDVPVEQLQRDGIVVLPIRR